MWILSIGEPLTANEWSTVECSRRVAKENEINGNPVVCAAIMNALLDFREDDEG